MQSPLTHSFYVSLRQYDALTPCPGLLLPTSEVFQPWSRLDELHLKLSLDCPPWRLEGDERHITVYLVWKEWYIKGGGARLTREGVSECLRRRQADLLSRWEMVEGHI